MKTHCLTSLIVCVFCAIGYAGPEPLASSGKEMKQPVVPPEPACQIDWTGFYVGLHIGYGWNEANTTFTPLPDAGSFGLKPTTLNPDPDGVVGGLQLGYNRQIGRFVLGVEADFAGSSVSGSKTGSLVQPDGSIFPGGFISTHQDMDWLGTFRGRVGFTPFCRLLVYGTGGLAYSDVNYTAEVKRLADYPVSLNETKVGWTVGGGAEYAFSRRWSVKVEYLYYDFGNQSATGNPIPPNPPFQVHYKWDTTSQSVTTGLNFRF
jgi:outer membrane immunogenic protein